MRRILTTEHTKCKCTYHNYHLQPSNEDKLWHRALKKLYFKIIACRTGDKWGRRAIHKRCAKRPIFFSSRFASALLYYASAPISHAIKIENQIWCLPKRNCDSSRGITVEPVFSGHEDAPKPVVRHLNLPNHSKQHMAVCGPTSRQFGKLRNSTTKNSLSSRRYLFPPLPTVSTNAFY